MRGGNPRLDRCFATEPLVSESIVTVQTQIRPHDGLPSAELRCRRSPVLLPKNPCFRRSRCIAASRQHVPRLAHPLMARLLSYDIFPNIACIGMLVVLSHPWPPLARCEHGRPRDERPPMRTSPQPRRRRDAAAFPPLVVPANTPDYARRVLARLDRSIAREAATVRDEPPSSDVPSPEARPRRPGATAEGRTTLVTSPTRDARLLIAGRMRARADGATAFFLFHYLRLLAEQAQARAAAQPCPRQTWAMPDWSPASPGGRPPVTGDPGSSSDASERSGGASRRCGEGNIIRSAALWGHGS